MEGGSEEAWTEGDNRTPLMMKLKCADCDGAHDDDKIYANINSVGMRRRRRRRRRRKGNVLW